MLINARFYKWNKTFSLAYYFVLVFMDLKFQVLFNAKPFQVFQKYRQTQTFLSIECIILQIYKKE